MMFINAVGSTLEREAHAAGISVVVSKSEPAAYLIAKAKGLTMRLRPGWFAHGGKLRCKSVRNRSMSEIVIFLQFMTTATFSRFNPS
jgi:hypothetical protein